MDGCSGESKTQVQMATSQPKQDDDLKAMIQCLTSKVEKLETDSQQRRMTTQKGEFETPQQSYNTIYTTRFNSPRSSHSLDRGYSSNRGSIHKYTERRG